MLLEGFAAEEDAALVAEKIVREMRADFHVDGTALRVTTSLGVGIAKNSSTSTMPSATALMACADQALYEAKRHGRDGFRISGYSGLSDAA